jgi:hypothetical protein
LFFVIFILVDCADGCGVWVMEWNEVIKFKQQMSLRGGATATTKQSPEIKVTLFSGDCFVVSLLAMTDIFFVGAMRNIYANFFAKTL